MTTKQQLTDHLADLEQAREEAYSAGNWDRVDLLGQCIDDTKAAIAKATK
jgi:hypothetical protein